VSVVRGQVVTVWERGHEMDRDIGTVDEILPGADAAGMPVKARVRFHRCARSFDLAIGSLVPFEVIHGDLALVPGATVILGRAFEDVGVMAGQLGRVVRLGDGPRLGPVVIVSTPGTGGARVEVVAQVDDVTCIGGPAPADPGERGNRGT
jgi:hypothetical protein